MPASPSVPADLAPVYVPAMCTLMGNDPRMEVAAGHPLILMWGWSAATEQQIRDYLDAAIVRVTFDGREAAGKRQGGTPYDQNAEVYRVLWTAEVGVPARGIHVVTYLQIFSAKIFDGAEYFGPGTKNEKQEDRCEIEVA